MAKQVVPAVAAGGGAPSTAGRGDAASEHGAELLEDGVLGGGEAGFAILGENLLAGRVGDLLDEARGGERGVAQRLGQRVGDGDVGGLVVADESDGDALELLLHRQHLVLECLERLGGSGGGTDGARRALARRTERDAGGRAEMRADAARE